MQLNIANAAQYEGLVDALDQYTANQREHLENLAEEGTRDPVEWAKLDAAESYLDTLQLLRASRAVGAEPAPAGASAG